MDDSDDYPIDEIVLDNQTLAVLDQEERKYFQEKSHLASTNPDQYINKRQKTLNGWAPGIGSVTSHGEIDDDLPEISLHGDGSYGIGNRVNSASRAPAVFPPPASRGIRAPRARTSSNLHQTNPSSTGIYQMSSGSHPVVLLPSTGNVPQRPAFLPPAAIERNSVEQAAFREKQPPIPYELQSQMLELQKKLHEVSIILFSEIKSCLSLCTATRREFEYTICFEKCP
jgi:hypothetical protein